MTQRVKIGRGKLLRRLAGIRLLSLDVDGVLTDGGLYYADDGSELRRFNVKDGMGMKMVRRAGVEIAIISASITPSIRHRAERLGIVHVHTGAGDKLATLETLCRDLGIGLEAVAHMGDDVNDLPVLKAVGLALTVPDAMPEVIAGADYVTRAGGGQGAVREICDLLIAVRG